jgi:hypothetical protein
MFAQIAALLYAEGKAPMRTPSSSQLLKLARTPRTKTQDAPVAKTAYCVRGSVTRRFN